MIGADECAERQGVAGCRSIRGSVEPAMERSRDWMDQAQGDLRHAKADLGAGFYEWPTCLRNWAGGARSRAT